MLVFIDESGDAGFKLSDGATPIFVAAMVIFADAQAAQSTEQVIRDTMIACHAEPEFKFSKCRAGTKDRFFSAVRSCPFTVRAIVVRKEVIFSPHLRADKENFYRFFVRQMMTHDDGALVQASVVIDSSGDRPFRKMLEASLRRQLGTRLKRLRFRDSRSDALVQLADMCVGAIARSYRSDRKDAWRWRQMLQPRIADVWNFR